MLLYGLLLHYIIYYGAPTTFHFSFMLSIEASIGGWAEQSTERRRKADAESEFAV
jgi:hypothetical protein